MTTPRTRRAVPLAIAATFAGAFAFAPAVQAESHSEDGETEMEDGGTEAEDDEMENDETEGGEMASGEDGECAAGGDEDGCEEEDD